MARIQQEVRELMQREKDSQKMLEKAFRGIGYSIDSSKREKRHGTERRE